MPNPVCSYPLRVIFNFGVVLILFAASASANERLLKIQRPVEATSAFIEACIQSWEDRERAKSIFKRYELLSRSQTKHPRGSLVYPSAEAGYFPGGLYDGNPNETLRCRVVIRGYWAQQTGSMVAKALSANGYKLIKNRYPESPVRSVQIALRATFRKSGNNFTVSVAQGLSSGWKVTVLKLARIGK